MPDAPDPPRKFYGFKPREFESANTHPPFPPGALPPPAPDPGIVPTHTGPIDVRDLNRLATTGQPLLSKQPNPARENEVHGVLRDNLAAANAAGLNKVTLDPNYVSPRQKRVRRMWTIIAAVDIPLALFAWKIGPAAAIPFVSALAAIGMVTGIQIWNTYFLNTD